MPTNGNPRPIRPGSTRIQEPGGISQGRRCGAKTRKGGKCQLPAGQGTPHPGIGQCKHHGGSTPAGIKSATRQMVSMGMFGDPIPDAEPGTELLYEVQRTAGHVRWLQEHIRNFESEDELTQDNVISGIAQPAVWLDIYHRERKHLAQVSKMALDAGVAERQVRIAEAQGQMLAEAIRGILEEIGVWGKPEVPRIVRRHLMALPGAAGAS